MLYSRLTGNLEVLYRNLESSEAAVPKVINYKEIVKHQTFKQR
jgi:hypothetical protein